MARRSAWLLGLCLAAACDSSEREAEVRQWLVSHWQEIEPSSLELEHLRRVDEGLCGEASFVAAGRTWTDRRFHYVSEEIGIFDSPLASAGEASLCYGADDQIARACAADDRERREVDIKRWRCLVRGDIR
jgi:hypothetical protein